jgi:hypothetical protein
MRTTRPRRARRQARPQGRFQRTRTPAPRRRPSGAGAGRRPGHAGPHPGDGTRPAGRRWPLRRSLAVRRSVRLPARAHRWRREPRRAARKREGPDRPAWRRRSRHGAGPQAPGRPPGGRNGGLRADIGGTRGAPRPPGGGVKATSALAAGSAQGRGPRRRPAGGPSPHSSRPLGSTARWRSRSGWGRLRWPARPHPARIARLEFAWR